MKVIVIIFFLFQFVFSFSQTIDSLLITNRCVALGSFSGKDDISGLFYEKIVNAISIMDTNTFLVKIDLPHETVIQLKDGQTDTQLLGNILDEKYNYNYYRYLTKLFELERSKKEVEIIGDITYSNINSLKRAYSSSMNSEVENFLSQLKSKTSDTSKFNIEQIVSEIMSTSDKELNLSEFEFQILKSLVYREISGGDELSTSFIDNYISSNIDHILVLTDNLTIKNLTSFRDLPIDKKVYLSSHRINYINDDKVVTKNFKCCNKNAIGLIPFFDYSEKKLVLNYVEGCKKYHFTDGEFVYVWH